VLCDIPSLIVNWIADFCVSDRAGWHIAQTSDSTMTARCGNLEMMTHLRVLTQNKIKTDACLVTLKSN
jgi:hypothetical protein